MTEAEKQRSPFTRPAFIGSACIVGLVLLLGAGILVFGQKDPAPGPSAAAPTTPSSTATAATSSRPAGGCDLPAGSQTVPVTAPTDTVWELVGTVAAPTDPSTVGPAVVDPTTGLRTCFARDPLGALYASVNFLASITDPDQLRAAMTTLTSPGPGQDTVLAQLAADSGGVGAGATRYQVAGFTFLSYSGTTAVLSVAIQAGGGYAGVPVTLQWEDGDWKVQLPPDGDYASRATQLPNLTGYAPWAGA